MIDGEIYTLFSSPETVFAYREDGIGDNPHYIGVNSLNHVCRYGDCRSVGFMGCGAARLANAGEIARFYRLLHNADYHWNKANKKVIRISTGEIL